MKTKLILKGILLYSTILIAIFSICGIDSIYDEGYFLHMIFIMAVLIYTCHKTISKEESDILSGIKLLENLPDDKL